MSISNQADFYLNFQQFGDMKLGARSGSDDAAKSVAGQFEGLFVQQMLAAMRSAAKIDSGQDSSYLNFYQEMYDKQLAQTVAGQNRLGVAKLIL
ncbi:MAG: rod-binding protein, partial [Gammaproteobacteria bacterium]|nr:rod-binding protein [Gammaproteobacteria bacterium]